jgi:hypothetical protein
MAKSTQTSTTTTKPAEWQMPYLSFGASESKRLYGQPLQYYPGETIAGFTPTQLQAQGLLKARSLSGSPVTAAAQGELAKTLSGGYLSPESNPYLSAYVQKGLEDVLPAMDTAAVAAGRYGSGAWGQMRGRAAGEVASNIYGQAYEAERNRQTGALQMAPSIAEMDVADLLRLGAVGSEEQAMEQAKIDEAINRWEFGQMEPWQRLANFVNLVSGDYGGVSTAVARGK